jgi:excisionase family DNA binding protein
MAEPSLELTYPPVAVNTTRAAEMLSVSRDTFRERIEPELKIVRMGARKLIPVAELQRWVAENAEALL